MKETEQIVAIVGRPNVGKSALFNRLVGKPIAIVEDRPGVTRDRHFGHAEWLGRRFLVIDTGGLDPDGEDPFQQRISDQAIEGIKEADQVIFLVDGREGVHPVDKQAAQMLRESGKPMWLAINKMDNDDDKDSDLVHEFYSLGLDAEPIAVSAIHGLGVDTLLDHIIETIPKPDFDPDKEPDDQYDGRLRIALVGRPNVGKSSIINKMLGEDRSLVSDVPGTTRDAVDSQLKFQGEVVTLVDTAGLRRKSRVHDAIEKYSAIRTFRAIKGCDVAVLVIDAERGVSEYDEHVAGMIEDAGRACVIAINKWDLLDDRNSTRMNECLDVVRKRMPFISWAEAVFVSAETGQRLPKILDACLRAGEAHCTRIPTSQLNEALSAAISARPEPSRKGKILKIKYVSQTSVRPPALALFVNDPKRMHFSYKRYLENSFRERFGFVGTPLILMLRERK